MRPLSNCTTMSDVDDSSEIEVRVSELGGAASRIHMRAEREKRISDFIKRLDAMENDDASVVEMQRFVGAEGHKDEYLFSAIAASQAYARDSTRAMSMTQAVATALEASRKAAKGHAFMLAAAEKMKPVWSTRKKVCVGIACLVVIGFMEEVWRRNYV